MAVVSFLCCHVSWWCVIVSPSSTHTHTSSTHTHLLPLLPLLHTHTLFSQTTVSKLQLCLMMSYRPLRLSTPRAFKCRYISPSSPLIHFRSPQGFPIALLRAPIVVVWCTCCGLCPVVVYCLADVGVCTTTTAREVCLRSLLP